MKEFWELVKGAGTVVDTPATQVFEAVNIKPEKAMEEILNMVELQKKHGIGGMRKHAGQTFYSLPKDEDYICTFLRIERNFDNIISMHERTHIYCRFAVKKGDQ